MRATGKILRARASEHSLKFLRANRAKVKFCKQLKIFNGPFITPFSPHSIIRSKKHMLSKEASHLKDKFSLLHLNIRSPQFNGNKLTDLFERLNFTFSVIGISETWLDES